MNARVPVQPNTPEERQAALTAQSAKDVLSEIDYLRRLLSADGQSKTLKRRAQADLEEASERLCNLLALAVYQISNSVQGELKDRLKAVVGEVRRRLLDMGTNLMIEKLRKIHDCAATVLTGSGYPIGLASKLEYAYAAIVENLTGLYGLERLSQADQQLIEQTAGLLGKLAEIENGLGILSDIEGPRPATASNRTRAS